MNWTVAQMTAAYSDFRHRGWLERGTWYRDEGHYKRACALGAAFHAQGHLDAVEKACVTGIMPRWLVTLTPGCFDYQNNEDAFAWADALYAQGGLIEQIHARPDAEAIWADAEQRLTNDIRTNECLANALGYKADSYEAETMGELMDDFSNYEDAGQAAGMVITAIQAALDAAS